jgi:hypothetical protein
MCHCDDFNQNDTTTCMKTEVALARKGFLHYKFLRNSIPRAIMPDCSFFFLFLRAATIATHVKFRRVQESANTSHFVILCRCHRRRRCRRRRRAAGREQLPNRMNQFRTRSEPGRSSDFFFSSITAFTQCFCVLDLYTNAGKGHCCYWSCAPSRGTNCGVYYAATV